MLLAPSVLLGVLSGWAAVNNARQGTYASAAPTAAALLLPLLVVVAAQRRHPTPHCPTAAALAATMRSLSINITLCSMKHSHHSALLFLFPTPALLARQPAAAYNSPPPSRRHQSVSRHAAPIAAAISSQQLLALEEALEVEQLRAARRDAHDQGEHREPRDARVGLLVDVAHLLLLRVLWSVVER